MAVAVIAAIEKVVGLSHAGLLAVGAVVVVIAGVLTLPDAGGLRAPREQ